MEKRIIIRSIIGSPVNIALLVITLLLLIGGGYWWLMGQPSPEDKLQQVADTQDKTVLPASSANTEADTSLSALDAEQSSDMDPTAMSAEDDSKALPPKVTEQTSSVGSGQDGQQRVVITSDVVDALIEGKPEKKVTPEDQNVVSKSSIRILPAKTESAPVAETVAPEPEKPTQPVVSFSFTKSELKNFSVRSYTLQLAAVQSLEEVQEFLDKHKLAGSVYIYPTVRNGADWYIITYQNYPTIQVARDAVESLPADIQQLDPWAKSLSQVHREIDRVK